MSKLTICTLNAIRKAVLADMPNVNYDDAIRARAHIVAAGTLPPAIQRLWADPLLQPWVHTRQCWSQSAGSYVLPARDYEDERKLEHLLENDAEISRLAKLSNEQDEAREAADRALKAAFSSIRSRAVFLERFPELASYLPSEETAAVANLPATTEVMDKLKAGGWPVKKAA